MIYTEMTKKAMRVCFEAHKDQTDKGGTPYVFHPYHIAEQMKSEDEVVVALLHDVVEDTQITFDDLRAEGFSKEVISALTLLTRCKNVPYTDYVRYIMNNELARRVKMEDLKHNIDLNRLNDVDGIDEVRIEKYRNALRFLERNGAR